MMRRLGVVEDDTTSTPGAHSGSPNSIAGSTAGRGRTGSSSEHCLSANVSSAVTGEGHAHGQYVGEMASRIR
jgi:hypothetical protein